GLMLVWLALSSLMFLIASRSAARLGDLGIPFVPLKLVPICALPTMFFLFRPVAQPLEVGELLLGMAALSFALDRAWHSGLSVSGWLPDRPAALGGALLLGALIGVGCAVHTPLNWMAWRLETLAARDYPTFGLYDQAERIFDFIYAHPDQLVREDTRLSHAEMLVSAGRIERARAIFDAVLSDLPDLASGERLRRIAVLHARLGDEEHAQASYRAALDADAAALEVAGDADHRARLKLSLARTFRALGALDEAARVAGEARDLAVLARTRDEIAKWLEELAAERH
ncbi:MAG: hypothetical protein R3349_10725, partial [Geminicoccaceae bacterium]|nr:hypothetical protein [Geminicoccaceae bacterium]